MDTQYHLRLQQARRRIARSRRIAERDVLRLTGAAKAKLNDRLQTGPRPLAMLAGAIGVGMIAARLLGKFSNGSDWQTYLQKFAERQVGGAFWKQLFETVMRTVAGSQDEATEEADSDSEDAS